MKRIVHKRNLKKIVRPALFTVGFAAVGFFYDLFLRRRQLCGYSRADQLYALHGCRWLDPRVVYGEGV